MNDENSTVERLTALHATHRDLGATFTDFGGWQMPLRYTSEITEHHSVRRAAGIFDLSHMGELEISGRDAGRFLDYALVSKLSSIAVGKAKYSLLCDRAAGIIDDLITYRLHDDRYLVVPNASNTDKVATELRRRATSFDVTIADVSAATALIAVQGPEAERILVEISSADYREQVVNLRYYAATEIVVDGVGVILARTGYTGEDGFELFLPAARAEQIWNALTAVGAPHGLVPCGLAARDSLRLEAGMALYGNELTQSGNPYAAGLGPVVSLTKEGDFVGRGSFEVLKELGVGETIGRRLVGLKGSDRRAARAHHPVHRDGAVVGEVTSGQPSPTLGYPIALAYVDVAHTKVGTQVDVDVRGKTERFEVVALPFYKRGT